MGQEKRYFWLKLPEGFFRQKEIKRLRKIAGGDTYTIIYLKMLLRSLANNGVLFFDGVENDFISELALDIDEDEENVAVTVQFLEKQGILVEISETEYLLTSCAGMVGSEAANAERMRQHRKKLKSSQCDGVASLGDSTVTNCDTCVITSDTEIDIEKEIEKEIEIEKSKKTSTKQPKHRYGEYGRVLLTDEEYKKLAIGYGVPTRDSAINFLDAYIAEKEYKSKSHYLAIRRWVIDAVKERGTKNTKKNDFDEWGELLDEARRSC